MPVQDNDLGPEGSKEPVQQGRDVVRGPCVKSVWSHWSQGVGGGQEGASRPAEGLPLESRPQLASRWAHRDRPSLRGRGGHTDRVSLVGQLMGGAQNGPLAEVHLTPPWPGNLLNLTPSYSERVLSSQRIDLA